MRRAFFVIGPESSGTRMMAESLISAGCYGDYSHGQRMDNMNFQGLPDLIVFRRSIPHADKWPPLEGIYKLIRAAGYEIVVLTMWRNEKYMILSQIKRYHVIDEEKAKKHIAKAYEIMCKFIDGKVHELVQYEDFVTDPEYRNELFWRYGLINPTIEYYNANEAYE